MRRRAEADLKKWYDSKSRKPLILRGARQVGKSTLVRNFAQLNGLELIEINFEMLNLQSAKDSLDIHPILSEIEYITKKKIKNNTLLFLDEIQDQPRMITSLRFFKEEKPDLAIIAAGSLLEFALSDNEISFPVGRIQFYHLSP